MGVACAVHHRPGDRASGAVDAPRAGRNTALPRRAGTPGAPERPRQDAAACRGARLSEGTAAGPVHVGAVGGRSVRADHLHADLRAEIPGLLQLPGLRSGLGRQPVPDRRLRVLGHAVRPLRPAHRAARRRVAPSDRRVSADDVAEGGGVAPAALAEGFPTAVRSSGMSLSDNTAVTILGGFAPAILTWITYTTGVAFAPALYVMGACVVALVALTILPQGRHG
ncbi:hypothetical protein G6F68_013740 [Rhizopus microsporus]|nr:hypothetical protein G6F68_013740 [Rhizopus microsporus]